MTSAHGGRALQGMRNAMTPPISTLVCSNCGASNRIGPSERGAPHCGKCGKPILPTADKTTIQDLPYHAACWTGRATRKA